MLSSEVLAGGVELAAGATTLTGDGGSEAFSIPLLPVGYITDGEQIEVNYADVVDNVTVLDDTVTMTCSISTLSCTQ